MERLDITMITENPPKKNKNPFKSPAAERILLGTIIRNGKNSLIDSQGLSISSTDFTSPINRAVYLSLEKLSEDPRCERFDIESVKMQAQVLGYSDILASPDSQKYIELLKEASTDKENLPMFGWTIKKYSVIRDLYERYQDAISYISNISGQEDLSEIIRNAEGKIIDFVTGIDNGDGLSSMGEDIVAYIQKMLESEPIDQVGIPTGYTLYDEAIGGGPRRGTVSVIGARPKVGKSFVALNMSRNIAKAGIPVLYLDTELTKSYQKNRLLSIESGCPLRTLENYSFNKSEKLSKDVVEAGIRIEKFPFYYQNISGMSHTEALAIARRWIVKNVGFNSQGKANDCVIVYDYMKLTSGEGLTKFTPEYITLGLMLTEMHNFAVKYEIPIIGFVQLNRDGIDNDDGSIIAGSDRILWLCSSMAVLRNKTEDDAQLCGWQFGNKKLSVMETRQGSGLENEGDYINLHASLRPGVSKFNATGIIREGFTYSQTRMNADRPEENVNKPGDNQQDSRGSQ